MFIFIHGQSSFISQFLHPTNLEIKGITTNPIKLNAIVKMSISIVYRVANKYIAIANGTNQFGNTIKIFCLNTFLNDLSCRFLNNLAEIAPYPQGQAVNLRIWFSLIYRPLPLVPSR